LSKDELGVLLVHHGSAIGDFEHDVVVAKVNVAEISIRVPGW